MDRAFLLVRTYDWESDEPDDLWRARLELYQAVTDTTAFRCRIWEYRRLAGPLTAGLVGEHSAYSLVDCTADFLAPSDGFRADSIDMAVELIGAAVGLPRAAAPPARVESSGPAIDLTIRGVRADTPSAHRTTLR